MYKPTPKQPPAPQTAEERQEEASELWLALTTLPRPTRLIPFPRTLPGTDIPAGEVLMWPLRQEEQQFASTEADRHVKKILKDPQRKDEANLGYHSLFSNELAVQILWRACRDPNSDKGKRAAFPSPGVMRKEFTSDEMGVLFANYLTVQMEVGPIVAYMSTEEQEAMILRLHEGGSAFPLDSLSPEEQKALALSMASRLVNCWMAMSSVGLPLDTSSLAESRVTELREEADKRFAELEKAEQTTEVGAPAPEPEPEEGK